MANIIIDGKTYAETNAKNTITIDDSDKFENCLAVYKGSNKIETLKLPPEGTGTQYLAVNNTSSGVTYIWTSVSENSFNAEVKSLSVVGKEIEFGEYKGEIKDITITLTDNRAASGVEKSVFYYDKRMINNIDVDEKLFLTMSTDQTKRWVLLTITENTTNKLKFKLQDKTSINTVQIEVRYYVK